MQKIFQEGKRIKFLVKQWNFIFAVKMGQTHIKMSELLYLSVFFKAFNRCNLRQLQPLVARSTQVSYL